MITTHTYRHSRHFWLARIAEFHRWAAFSPHTQNRIQEAFPSRFATAAPEFSDKQAQLNLAKLRRQFWEKSNDAARLADTHAMIGRAHLTIVHAEPAVLLTWQWFDRTGERRSKEQRVPASPDIDRELERIELAERPYVRGGDAGDQWASRDWVPVELI